MFNNNKAKNKVGAKGKPSNSPSSFLFKTNSRHSSKKHPASEQINIIQAKFGARMLSEVSSSEKSQGYPNDTLHLSNTGGHIYIKSTYKHVTAWNENTTPRATPGSHCKQWIRYL